MRVLFASWAWRSHYFPLVPLGWALRAAGHELRVASQPGFADVITQSGLPAVPVGRDVDVAQLLADNMGDRLNQRFEPVRHWPTTVEGLRAAGRLDGAVRGIRHFIQLAEIMADDLVGFARAWRPDLVVFEPTTFAAPLAAEVAGVPSARHLWTADFTAGITELGSELLRPLGRRFGRGGFDPLGTVTLDPCPPRLQISDDLPRQPIRYVPYNGPAVQPSWLMEPPSRRRVCVTWGTSIAGLRLDHMFRVPAVLEALAGLDVDVVASLPASQHALLGSVPAGTRVVDSVPLHLSLPTCAAVVQQGGGGTTMTAMTCGVPQLVVPHLPDQIFNAQQLTATGAGIFLHGAEATPALLRERIAALLDDPRYRAGAGRLRDEAMAMPAPTEVVGVLERLARTGAWQEPPGRPAARNAVAT